MPVSSDGKVTIDANTFTRLDDARMRLARIERDLEAMADDYQDAAAADRHDGDKKVAERIRKILA